MILIKYKDSVVKFNIIYIRIFIFLRKIEYVEEIYYVKYYNNIDDTKNNHDNGFY